MQILPISQCERHLDTIAHWLWEEWKETSGLTLEETRVQTLGRSTCPPTLVAVMGAEPVGVLAFRRAMYRGREPVLLFINSLFVRPSERRRGVGTILIAEALDRVGREDTAVYVFTQIREWYEARGFTVVEEDPETSNFILRRENRETDR